MTTYSYHNSKTKLCAVIFGGISTPGQAPLIKDKDFHTVGGSFDIKVNKIVCLRDRIIVSCKIISRCPRERPSDDVERGPIMQYRNHRSRSRYRVPSLEGLKTVLRSVIKCEEFASVRWTSLGSFSCGETPLKGVWGNLFFTLYQPGT